MLENDKFVDWANENVIVVVGHREDAHEFEEVEGEDGETVRQCKLYPGLTCDQHEALASDAHHPSGDLPAIEQKSGVPNSWLVAPTGEVREIPSSEQQQYKKIIEAAEAFQEEVGEHLTLDDYEEIMEDLQEGDAAFEEGEYKDALKAWGKVEKDLDDLPPAMAERVRARIDGLNERVMEQIEEIRASEEAPKVRLRAARDLLSSIRRRLEDGYIPAKEAVEALIKELKDLDD